MDRDQLLTQALGLGEEGDWQGSAESLRDHLGDFPEDAAIHCWLGVAEQELGLGGVAYERFKHVLSIGTEDPYVLATVGNGIAYFDDPDAEQTLRTASILAPDVAVTRLMYGAYLAREGFTEQGVEELTAARELDPDDPQIAYELGVGWALAGDHGRATDALADAVRLDPEDGWARVVFGLELLEAYRFEEGAGELMSGARIREDDVDAQVVAALAAAAIGHDGTAYEMLERARMRSAEPDVALLTAVEDRLDAGPDAAKEMLEEDLAPDLLRTRLRERP